MTATEARTLSSSVNSKHFKATLDKIYKSIEFSAKMGDLTVNFYIDDNIVNVDDIICKLKSDGYVVTYSHSNFYPPVRLSKYISIFW